MKNQIIIKYLDIGVFAKYLYIRDYIKNISSQICNYFCEYKYNMVG